MAKPKFTEIVSLFLLLILMLFISSCGQDTPEPPVIAVESVKIQSTTTTVQAGGTLKLEVTVLPADASDKTVIWSSSDASVASVDSSGLVTAHKVGNTKITAASGKASDSVDLKIIAEAKPVTALEFKSGTLMLARGTTSTTPEIVITPIDTTDSVVLTSDNPDVLIVSGGSIVALNVGTATLTATATSGVSDTCSVTVIEPIVELTFNYDEEFVLPLTGEPYDIRSILEVKPAGYTGSDLAFSSSDEKVFTVDEDGLVTAMGVGQGILTASGGFNDVSGQLIINVTDDKIEAEITLDKTSISIENGMAGKLSATVTGTALRPVWSSEDPDIAEVDSEGNLTARGVGTTTVTASIPAAGVSASCEVTVRPAHVLSVSMDQTSLTVTEGDTAQLRVLITPETAVGNEVTWSSSDEAVASVSDTGLVTAKSTGQTTITAEADEKSASCVVTVARAGDLGTERLVPPDWAIGTFNGQVDFNLGTGAVTTYLVVEEDNFDLFIETDPNIYMSGVESFYNGRYIIVEQYKAEGDYHLSIKPENTEGAAGLITDITLAEAENGVHMTYVTHYSESGEQSYSYDAYMSEDTDFVAPLTFARLERIFEESNSKPSESLVVPDWFKGYGADGKYIDIIDGKLMFGEDGESGIIWSNMTEGVPISDVESILYQYNDRYFMTDISGYEPSVNELLHVRIVIENLSDGSAMFRICPQKGDERLYSAQYDIRMYAMT